MRFPKLIGSEKHCYSSYCAKLHQPCHSLLHFQTQNQDKTQVHQYVFHELPVVLEIFQNLCELPLLPCLQRLETPQTH
uniref:Uncharacterized protein n=1 Tax=Arundo donax TaxID=35708 RepID=A0A0A9EFK6_ARUDO